jgi:hypothetical protein
MVSSGLLRRVVLVRTDVSEEPGASFIRVAKIGELGTTQAATSNRRRLRFAAYVGCRSVGIVTSYEGGRSWLESHQGNDFLFPTAS